MNFVTRCTKIGTFDKSKIHLCHFKFSKEKSVFYGTNSIILRKKRGWTTADIRFWSRGKCDQEYNCAIFSAFWPFLKLVLYFACSTTCSNAFLCWRAFWRRESCFVSLNSSELYTSISWFCQFWRNWKQIFLFVYMRENKFLSMKWHICIIHFFPRRWKFFAVQV